MKCKLKNLEVNYEVYGSGTPVIMLHGSPVDHRIMEGCMEPIFKDKNDYKRIYIDMPGHGLQMEQEELFNSLVNEWLKKVKSLKKLRVKSNGYFSSISLRKNFQFIVALHFH